MQSLLGGASENAAESAATSGALDTAGNASLGALTQLHDLGAAGLGALQHYFSPQTAPIGPTGPSPFDLQMGPIGAGVGNFAQGAAGLGGQGNAGALGQLLGRYMQQPMMAPPQLGPTPRRFIPGIGYI